MRTHTIALTCVLALAAASAHAGRLFAVLADGSDSIAELNPATGAELNRFDAPEPSDEFSGLAFDGDRLYFLQDSGADVLYELDPDTGAQQNSWALTDGSGSFNGLAALDGLVYVLDSTLDVLHVFDPGTGLVTVTIDPGVGLIGGAGAIGGPDALLASNGSFLYEIDLATHSASFITDVAPLAALGVASVDGEIWVSGYDVDTGGNRAEVFSRDGVFLRSVPLTYNVGALAGAPDVIPEPASLSLLALAALALRRRRQRQ